MRIAVLAHRVWGIRTLPDTRLRVIVFGVKPSVLPIF
jgi:hypothetical protein